MIEYKTRKDLGLVKKYSRKLADIKITLYYVIRIIVWMTVVHKKREQENEHKHTTEREERRETEGGREGGRGGGKNGAGIGRRESNSIFTR